jgi:hypothetical protein
MMARSLVIIETPLETFMDFFGMPVYSSRSTLPFAGARITAPTAINNVGQIVGFYYDNNVTASFPNGHAHGFIYDKGGFNAFDFPEGVATYQRTLTTMV